MLAIVLTRALNRGQLFEALWPAVSTPVAKDGKTLGVQVGKLDASVAKLAVSDIKAASTKTVTVTFNKPVSEDQQKLIKFEVLRGKTPVTVDAAWNSDATVATLTNKTTFAIGEYSVTVSFEGAELAKEDLKFEQQKIARIDILSDDVAVNPKDSKGYVVYRVYDQYENDITEHYLAGQINFVAGAEVDIDKTKKGVLVLSSKNSATSLLMFPQIPITAYENSSGISVSKTLATVAKVGSISAFNLVPENEIVIVNGDYSTTVEIPYEAYDQTGNRTTNYILIKDGLIFAQEGTTNLITSMENVKVSVVQDSKDNNKARVIARFTKGTVNINTDLQVLVTAMLYNGKSSAMNITLKQANELASFKLLSPASVVAENDKYFDVPYDAYDKDGNKITSFALINGKVLLSGGAAAVEDAQGNFKVRVHNNNFYPSNGINFSKDTPIFLTSSVIKNANFSQLQVVVQKPHDTDALYNYYAGKTVAIEEGFSLPIYFGEGGDMYVQDQYGRYQGMHTEDNLTVRPADPGVVTINGGNFAAFTADEKTISIVGNSGFPKERSVDVDFILTRGTKEIAKKTVTFVVVPSRLITSFDFDHPEKTYVDARDLANPSDRDNAFGVVSDATGRTNSGVSGILLKDYSLTYSVTNTQEFAVSKENVIIGVKPLRNEYVS